MNFINKAFAANGFETDPSLFQRIAQQAASGGGSKNFEGIVTLVIQNILDPVIILLLALALVYFMWGVLLYVNKGSEGGDRTKGIQMMSYGILAIFVMVSVWGLVYILINTFSLDNNKPPIPKLPTTSYNEGVEVINNYI